MNSRPNMVENQSGFIDITQSIAMKVTAKAQKIRPGPASLAMVCARPHAAFAVFAIGPAVQQPGEKRPATQVINAARIQEERHVEIGCFVLQHRIVRHDIRIAPSCVESGDADDDRHEQHQPAAESSRGRFARRRRSSRPRRRR